VVAAGAGVAGARGAAVFGADVPRGRGDGVAVGVGDASVGVLVGGLCEAGAIDDSGARLGRLKNTTPPIATKATVAAPTISATRADPGTGGV